MPTSSPPPPPLNLSHKKPSKQPAWKSTFFLLSISMSSLLLLSLLSLTLFFNLSSSSRHHHQNPPSSPRNSPVSASNSSQIRLACQSTRFPQPCETSLTQSSSPLPPNPTSLQIIHSAISVSSQNLKTGQSMVKSILDSSKGNLNRTNAATICLEILSYSDYRMKSANDALTGGKIKDARAWMSAALCYQYDCWSALKYVNDTKLVDQTMAFLDTLTQYSSNALSMMGAYDNQGDDIASWTPPKTEREGFYEKGSGGTDMGFNGGFPSDLKVDVTVCKDGSGGCYKTVQEAVNAAPDNAETKRYFVIHIKEGVYEETVRVPFEKKNVVFLGDGMGKTIITGSLNVGQPGITTYNTATVGILGDGFMASGLTIKNTAGPDAHQAVAFRSDSDLSVIENCEFLGNQDTLYVHSLRQFYKKCRIQGNVDFIFGNSASVFQDCEILVAPRQLKPEKGENNAITAHGRTDPAQLTGLVFQNCLLNGTDEYMRYYYSKPKVHKNYLGRPWKEYSRTVYINCVIEALVSPNGWMPWSGDFALKTLFYGEFRSSGPGSNVSKRVPWSTQIPSQHVYTYSVQNFIQGDQWIPTSS